MKEIYGASDELFSAMITVDVIVANIWMAFLLIGAGISDKIDGFFKGDTSAIKELKEKVQDYHASISKVSTLTDIMIICAIGFGGTAIAHLIADTVTPIMQSKKEVLEAYRLTSMASNFFWIVVVATVVGVAFSFTKLKQYEGAGASKFGSAFLYVLVATIGMKMDIMAIFDNIGLFLVGLICMLVHVIILLGVAKLIKRVGDLTHFRAHLAHLGNTASVIRDRAVGVDGHGDADSGQHANRCNANTIKPGQSRRDVDDRGQDQQRDHHRLHADGQTGDHHRCRTSFTRGCDLPHGGGSRVVFGDQADGDATCCTTDHSEPDVDRQAETQDQRDRAAQEQDRRTQRAGAQRCCGFL